MIIKASLRNAKFSFKKINRYICFLKKKPIKDILNFLKTNNNLKFSIVFYKILKSAISNAINNYKINFEFLKLNSLVVNKASNLKRISFRAKGRSDKILKRRCHIFLTLKYNGK